MYLKSVPLFWRRTRKSCAGPRRPGLQQVNPRRVDLREKIRPPSYYIIQHALDMFQVANDWLRKGRPSVIFCR
jgi:hypothetical protein